jgi:hypothetical protein
MNQIINQKYVNKIKSVKCDICNKDITGYKPEALQSGLISDEVITSHALYHISKHYREEVPAELGHFMIIEEEEKNFKPQPQPQPQQVKPNKNNNNNNNKKVKQPQPTKEKEELAKCKLCGETSVAFNFKESMAEHLENYHKISEIVDLPTEWFYEGVSA